MLTKNGNLSVEEGCPYGYSQCTVSIYECLLIFRSITLPGASYFLMPLILKAICAMHGLGHCYVKMH